MRIGFGKTVGSDHAIYARGMRHSDVTMCPIGALGLWFFHRFFLSTEMETINFRLNNSWFNKKNIKSIALKTKSFSRW